MQFKIFIIFFGVITIFDQLNLLKNSLKAQIIDKSRLSQDYVEAKDNNQRFLFSLKRNQFELNLKNNFYENNNLLIDFIIGSNQTNESNESNESDESKFNIEIESDIQYEENGIFYAEGNVVIYLSNGKLTGDKAIYDKDKREFILENNITFIKGSQYFEASRLIYNFSKEKGIIDDVTGILDLKSKNNDFNLEPINKEDKNFVRNNMSNLEYTDLVTTGLLNNFERKKGFYDNDEKSKIPEINKWRFKSKKIILDSTQLKSNEIYFTNDVFNKPQLVLRSNDFNAQIVDDKIKLNIRKNSILLDNLVKFPIRNQSIFNNDSASTWGIGSDYSEKDGYFIFRDFGNIKLFDEYELRLKSYFLVERLLDGNTKNFRENGAPYYSKKVKNDISLSDLFALDAEIINQFGDWGLLISSSINTFDIDKFEESNRTKIIFNRTYNLNQPSGENYRSDNEFIDFVDLKFYSAFRDKVNKGFSEDSEIYFVKGFTLSNRKGWFKDDKKIKISYIYDFGKFKAEKINNSSFEHLLRNAFAFNFDYKFPLWQMNNLDQSINKDYRFSPMVINQGINWNINIDGGLFIYGNGANQEAISLSTGPTLTIGSLKDKFFDYSKLNLNFKFIAKSGESAFKFDDIDKTDRMQISFDQQIIGPLIFGYATNLKLDSNSGDNKVYKSTYKISVNRRAYSFGIFYDTISESLGARFNLFNIDYDKIMPNFE